MTLSLDAETVLPSISRLVGAPVVNSRGDEIGRVEDLLVDASRGRIACAALSFSGFLGIEGRWFGVPWQALTFDPRNGSFIFDVDRQTVENAPLFDRSVHESMDADSEWLRGVYIYYGHAPYREQG
jgi:hypothetical protein